MSSNSPTAVSRSLSGMRRVLAEASERLAVVEGSLEHEKLAIRVLRLFDSVRDEGQVLAAALNEDHFPPLDPDDEVALAQLGAAAILLWDEIGASARQELLRTAVTIAGLKRTTDAGERLRRMLAARQAQLGPY